MCDYRYALTVSHLDKRNSSFFGLQLFQFNHYSSRGLVNYLQNEAWN